MQIDDISFNDISIFHPEEKFSIFHKLNFTRTEGGKEWLRRFFLSPFNDIEKIKGTQYIIQKIALHIDAFPAEITNGTILVMDKFLHYNLDSISKNPGMAEAGLYRIFHSADYEMTRFSIKHFADFFRGLKKISELFSELNLPENFQIYIDRINQILLRPVLKQLSETAPDKPFGITRNLFFAANVRGVHRRIVLELMDIYHRIDAWYSMAKAVKEFDLSFPEFIESDMPVVETQGLYHLLLEKPVPYDLMMNPDNSFLFLTGANMAGKSTLIKTVGGALFLAHLGMGVPAKKMKLTMFDGLISNINVVDNITKGESFFYNEVQRIKATIEKIGDGKKWFVLIDELFKGTNIQDAMRCSAAVIKGLVKVKHALFILSTHLYEVAQELEIYSNITFRHFETTVTDNTLSFSYHLKEGVSKDRLGYLILQREKVVEMLEEL
jgi:DNA mismatch repair ATPase MutS